MVAMLVCGVFIIVSVIQNTGYAELARTHGDVYGEGILTLLFCPKGVDPLDHLFFFVFLNLIFWGFWWPVAMDQWHRCAATQSDDIPTDGIFGTTGKLTFTYLAVLSLLFAVLGALANCHWGGPITEPLQTIVSGYINMESEGGALGVIPAIVTGFFLAGLLAAIISTTDTYLVVAAQSGLADLKDAERIPSVHHLEQNVEQDRHELPWARVAVLSVGSVTIVASFFLARLFDIYEVIYASFAVQFASLGPLLVAIIDEDATTKKHRALRAILVSGAAAITGMSYIIYTMERSETPEAYYRWLYAYPEVVMLISFVLVASPKDYIRLIRFVGTIPSLLRAKKKS